MSDQISCDCKKSYRELIPRSIIRVREMIEEAKIMSVYLEVLENHDGVHEKELKETSPYGPESPKPPRNIELEEVLNTLNGLMENNRKRFEYIIHTLYGDF